MAAFKTSAPSRTPLGFADERVAWTGVLPETQTPITLEAAGYHGRPVSFELVAPWTAAPREPDQPDDDSTGFGSALLILVLLVAAIVLARRNLLSGRADRRGAFRLASTLFFVYASFWLLLPHLSNLDQEMNRLFVYLGVGLFVGGAMYLVYLAIEPFLRRTWPTMLVGWSRALAGHLPDPVIGRDLLIGVVSGLLLAVLDQIGVLAPVWLSGSALMPMTPETGALEHTRYFLLTISSTMNSALQNALLGVMMFTVLREIVKRGVSRLPFKRLSTDYTAAVVALILLVLLRLLDSGDSQGPYWLGAALNLATTGVFLAVLLRYGLFATVVMYAVQFLVARTPLTLNSNALYAGPAWAMLAVVFAIGLTGFWMARRGEAR